MIRVHHLALASVTLLAACAGDDLALQTQAVYGDDDYGDGPTDGPVGDGPQFARFAEFDADAPDTYGVRGVLPPNDELADVYDDMTESQRRGLAVWHLFGANRGDFFSTLRQQTWNGGNMLRVVDSRGRHDRFDRLGTMNDPDCTQRTEPDEFGLYIDDCPRDPYSTGVVGLRLRPNPDFDMEAWRQLGDGDVERAAAKWMRKPENRFEWKSDDMEKTVAVEPPYEVVMTCTVCHAAPNPLDPPDNPNEPSWKEMVFALGNQYFKEGAVFVDGIPDDDFLNQVLTAQHPGTSDTSRMATDHIFNPNTINAIFNLGYRPFHPARVSQYDAEGEPVYNPDIKPETCDGDTCEVDTFRVLKDGADSSGVTGAALRVFVNIGSCFEQFSANMDPVWGVRHPDGLDRIQTPVSRRRLVEECEDYQKLFPYAAPLVDYLTFVKPYQLKDAPGGAELVRDWDDPLMERGRQVFAEECATCHSSKQPEFPTGEPTDIDVAFEFEFATWSRDQQIAWLRDPERVAWFKEQVEDPAFFAENYLSDDKRYPVSLLGTNTARALATNAGADNVWEEYGSVEYRTMPAVDIPLFRFDGRLVDFERSVEGPVGKGYYRTPSLWGIWTSAPFLHNNALGDYNGGWQVDDRLAAYDDGMRKLLGLRGRSNKVAKTDKFVALTTLPLGFDLPDWIPFIDLSKLRLGLPIPKGVPIAAVANLEVSLLRTTSLRLADVVRILVEGPRFFMELVQGAITVFDPIENRGHEFGLERSTADKLALIEFLKTL